MPAPTRFPGPGLDPRCHPRTSGPLPHPRPKRAPGWLLASLLGAGALLSAASASERKHYCVRRSSLVPVPAPALRSAEPAQGAVELGVANDTVLYLRAPKRLAGSNVGLYVPREQLALQFLASIDRIFSIGVAGEVGLSSGAIPVAGGLIPVPDQPTGGGGLSFGFHIPVHRRVTIDIGCDVWGYSVPSRVAWIQRETCSGLPDPRTWSQKTVTTSIFLGRVQVGVGIDLGWSHLTLGAGVRNQPHNTDSTSEWLVSEDEIKPVIAQEAYPYLHAFWDIRAASWLRVGIALYQPLAFDPVAFAPVVGIQVRLIAPKPSSGPPPAFTPPDAGILGGPPPPPPPPPPRPADAVPDGQPATTGRPPTNAPLPGTTAPPLTPPPRKAPAPSTLPPARKAPGPPTPPPPRKTPAEAR